MKESEYNMEFHHIGIACDNIDKCKGFIKSVFQVKEESETVFDENQDVHACIISLDNNLTIELLSGKRVENIVRKGITYYHTCYTVKNLNAIIKRLEEEHNAKILSPPKEAILYGNKRTAFLHTPIGIIELLEK